MKRLDGYEHKVINTFIKMYKYMRFENNTKKIIWSWSVMLVLDQPDTSVIHKCFIRFSRLYI